MNVLIVTNIFPNRLDPCDAAYNRRQFGELGKLCNVEVLALVPWFPGARWFGRRSRAGKLAALPARWRVDGLEVWHPRVLYVPRIGRRWSGELYTASLLPHVFRRRRALDVVLGAFAYPDGWAAVALSRMLGVPCVLKVHGTDVHTLPNGPLAGAIRWALTSASAVVGPSRPLVARAVELGANPARARVVPNGIDRGLFFPADRPAARRELGLPAGGRQILFVGRLEPQKGTGELLAALALLSRTDVRLVMIGDGPSRAAHERFAKERGLCVRFTGWQPHDRVARWLAASDVLALPSWAEGTPNVVLEALASGRPVVATRVGGIPEVVCDQALGELVPPRSVDALAAALERVLSQSHDAGSIARLAGLTGWGESARLLFEVLQEVRQPARSASAEASSLSETTTTPRLSTS